MLGFENDAELKNALGRNVRLNKSILHIECSRSNTFRTHDYGAFHWQHYLSFNEGQILSALPLRELEVMISKLSIREGEPGISRGPYVCCQSEVSCLVQIIGNPSFPSVSRYQTH